MNANDLFKAITELDLSPIKLKLMHVESGEGWPQEKADTVEKEYRRFLCMMKLYPDEDIAPVMDVDIFWHYHILDTMKYAVDCEKVFGYFQHHYPYVGLRGGDDEQFRIESGERMRELYEATFGDVYPGALAEAGDTAYSAGPHIDTAYSAGPHIKTAYSAGPHIKTAYSAGPHIKTAYSAGPHIKTAYSAGPHIKAAGSGITFNAGARDDAAFCLGLQTRAPSLQIAVLKQAEAQVLAAN
jgi:hypothetical protein